MRNLMLIYLNCTANLGDFLNALPVLSGIYKEWNPRGEKINFIIRNELRRIKGIKEFLMYQGIFNSVEFDDEVAIFGECILLSSWTREDNDVEYRPIETARYANYLNDNYSQLPFKVDDNFLLKVPEKMDVEIKNTYYCGDRWDGIGIDARRKSNTLKDIDKVTFLDYNNDMLTNAYIIKNCKNPFISTFTGISNIADLLNKKQIVLWGDDIANWDNKPITYSFNKHYYGNRNSHLMYKGDFEIDKIDEYFNLQG